MCPTLGSSEQYRDFAAQCRNWAVRASDEKLRGMMLQLAKHWMQMAQDLERLGGHPDAASRACAPAPAPPSQFEVRQHDNGKGAPAPERANFSTEEWVLLLESTAMAGLAVTGAEPGRVWHLIKESCAAVNAGVQASMNPAANPLVRAVGADFATAQGRSIACDGLREHLAGLEPGEVRSRSIETLERAAAIVDAKAPADAAAFKCWLLHISERVAEAARKSALPGAGGAPAGGAQSAAFAEISRALRLKLVA